MKYLMASVVCASFFSLIGFAVWFTDSAYPLWALLLTPSFKSEEEDSE